MSESSIHTDVTRWSEHSGPEDVTGDDVAAPQNSMGPVQNLGAESLRQSLRGASLIHGNIYDDEVIDEDEDAISRKIRRTSDFRPPSTAFEMIRKRILIPGLPELDLTYTHIMAIEEFIENPAIRLLVAFADQNLGFCVEHNIPTVPVKHLCYFIKPLNMKVVSGKTFLNDIMYGSIKGGKIESLHRVMFGIYAPMIFENKWSKSIQNDFAFHLHRFLASLIDTRWKLQGKTVLYVTEEGWKLTEEEAAKDKDLVQRLEVSVIHWARKIKDVVTAHDAIEMAENSSPLDEIDFWKHRCIDLSGITIQLDKLGVKRITRILEFAKSSYLAPFLKLSGQIKDGSKQAESNLKFLNLLKEPCTKLMDAKVKDISNLLPSIINTIRFIWIKSDFYNTRELLTGLFKKLSNQIIGLCSAKINLDRIFDGWVISGCQSLQECICCCEEWKDLYDMAAKAHHRLSHVPWTLDYSIIFAQVDAFIQRCKEMLEVCEAHIQFGQQDEGKPAEMPHFAGIKSLDIVRELEEVRSLFKKAHSQLRLHKKSILDVTDSSWHETYNRFQEQMRELEMFMQNTIILAFSNVSTVQEGVAVLDIFHHFRSRELIRTQLTKLTTDVVKIFMEELNNTKKEMSNKDAWLGPSLPKYAGSVHFTELLKMRCQKPMMVFEQAYFLPKLPSYDESVAEFKGLIAAFDEFMLKTYTEWVAICDKEPIKRLDIPLLVRRHTKPPRIDLNFDGTLLKMMKEVYYWNRMNYEIPIFAGELFARSDMLLNMIELVMLVVRDYNRVTSDLSLEEQGLFRERLRILDKNINPGLTKINWMTKEVVEFFIYECRQHCSSVQKLVDSYKRANLDISMTCVDISEMLLLKIDPKVIYQYLQFEEVQAKHREMVRKSLTEKYDSILSRLQESYEVHKNEGPEVQLHWNNYTEKIDCMVEEAFRLNVKGSLQLLFKSINGDGKSSPNPLFKVKVVLEEDKVEFCPTLSELASILCDIGRVHLIDALDSFMRLPELWNNKKYDKPPIFECVRADEEIQKLLQNISASVQTNALNMQAYLSTWDTYREIWEINKDAFIGRYQKLNPQTSSFDADIARYNEVANNVQMQETILNIQFVLLDCSSLKAAILSHCHEWQHKFTTLLKNLATESLQELTNYLINNSLKIAQTPLTLNELVESLQLWDNLNSNRTIIEDKFAPLMEQFVILDKYEVHISYDIREMLAELPQQWESFVAALLDSEAMLKKYKEIFKNDLLQQARELKKQISELQVEFNLNGPFSDRIWVTDALESIEAFTVRLNTLKGLETEIRQGLNIFKIDQVASKELITLEKDLESIKMAWTLASMWLSNWKNWKTVTFVELHTSELEETCGYLFKNLKKLYKSLKDKRWMIVETTKYSVEKMRRILPLINDLKNHAMRPRHWNQIQEEMHRTFDHTSPSFTLEKIVDFNFDTHAEMISSISLAATKELTIELNLNSISQTWETKELDILPFKDKGLFKLGSVDEIFQALEDNQVILTSMKASRYVKPFEKEVHYWERTLSNIMEVLETMLVIQKHWMHLENIFLGDDIRKQLPKETVDFDYININWKQLLIRLFADKNALRGTNYPGTTETLADMLCKLDSIRKNLDLFLETKRCIFPRFYFLSNDDLLEILGQSKNPESIQPHLKKCFDNIKLLKIGKAPGNQKFEAGGMYSADGEFVEFSQRVLLDGPVEFWLADVEKAMKGTLKEILRLSRVALKKNLSKRDKWFKDWPGQICITAGLIQWTSDVTKVLTLCNERSDMKPLKNMKKRQVIMLTRFSDTIRTNLSKIQRLKVVALVTIEVHARDIIERLLKTGATDVNAFEWICQLRFYWEKEYDDCVIRQTNAHFLYGYEYLGNSGRLVITPLTDRCFITLSTGLNLYKGSCLKGPASTGKTETVKDFGKNLGLYVLVVNCSEGLDYKSIGRLYAGLAQTGAWGSFDEMNRINIEVLSVVAQQILSILTALANHVDKFVFEGQLINIVSSAGFFITMNPGYAGRSELPENLKSLFRPFAMVVPDSTLISEIFLFAKGFSNTKVLAKRTYSLYFLSKQQLSRQDHYDFDLRAIVTMLKYAGKKKRLLPQQSDEETLYMSMRDMCICRLVPTDIPVFLRILSDLFPEVTYPDIDNTKFLYYLTEELKDMKLQVTQTTVTKVQHLLNAKMSRHSVMLVGATLSGKSTIWQSLQATINRLSRAGEGNYQLVKVQSLNPKAVSIEELFGHFDVNGGVWQDGILSSVLRELCADEKPDEKWIVLDGPVDTQWVENLNSLMDQNKVLTLINGERISLSDQVSLLFEIEDLAMASPATISRSTMVYCDYKDMGFSPYLDTWLSKKQSKVQADVLSKCVDVYLYRVLEFKAANCREPVPIAELNGIISMCRLFDTLTETDSGGEPEDSQYFQKVTQMFFQFCLIWSICATVDEDGRKKVDNCIREMVGTFPNRDTVYEYYVDTKSKNWAHWEDQLSRGWKYNTSLPFYKLSVPTVDSVRYQYLSTALIHSMNPVLLTGPVGTGKTLILERTLMDLDKSDYHVLTINLSAQTSSSMVQNIIEARVEKYTKGVFVPVGSKKMVTFMDDLNMPAKDKSGFQPPLELLKHWLHYGFWFDRDKNTVKYIRLMLLVSAMGPPGGGRMVISNRLLSRYNLINMTFPQDSQIKWIFSCLINQKLEEFNEDLKQLGNTMTQGTIEVYQAVVQRFLPTPTKIHYLFNMRDISRVFQGLLRADKNHHDTSQSLIRLWVHECFRVFSDRLIDPKDIQSFTDLVTEKLGTVFGQTFNNLCPNKVIPIFGDFMNEDLVYENITSLDNLKAFMQENLEMYNNTPKTVKMDLVLFKDAVEHVSRIVRVIRQPRGHMLLIGINGIGRQSLTRLASYLCQYQVFQIEIFGMYGKTEFREDLKRLYYQTGVENSPTVFLFSDVQALDRAFLEDVNSILSSGEVANMYSTDELEAIKNDLSEALRYEGLEDDLHSVYAFLTDRVRTNLHVVLCMSLENEEFRNSIRMFPAVVNHATMSWFSGWPPDALLEVADKFLSGMSIGATVADKKNFQLQNKTHALAQMFMIIHKSVAEYSVKMFQQYRRYNCVSPTNYLELVTGYQKLLQEKSDELINDRDKLRNGLSKIDETREKVEKMSVELEEAKITVAVYQKQCDEFLKTLVQQKREADEQQRNVAVKSERIREEEVKCQMLADVAKADLEEAMPALDEAIKALESLNKRDMTEIKSYGRPPVLVEKVMEAVMILRGNEPTWAEAKKQLGDQNFLKQLMNYDKDNITDKVLRKIGTYVAQSDFHPEIIGGVSLAAKSLCMWVRAMEMYGRIYRVVEPKKIKLNAALAILQEKQAHLAEAKAKLEEIEAKLMELKLMYDEKLAQKEELRRKAEFTELMLDRAQTLMTGLHAERIRWEERVEDLEECMGHLIGDVLLASAFLSYMGPFLTTLRDSIINHWKLQIRRLNVSCAGDFNFCNFMTKPTQVRDWNIQGLPRDEFSTENGVIVTRGQRWPLMVDPQGQGLRWIKNMEQDESIVVLDTKKPKYLNQVKNAIWLGHPVILTNVMEKLDPALNPILNKSLISVGDVKIMKIGDQEVEYNDDFRFYMATKLNNPSFTPDILIKVAVINFMVMDKGLEAQLLGIVVRKEKPELEEQKDSLVCSIAAGKKKLVQCEDEILRLLNETKGSLLDDAQLVDTLQLSKTTSQEVFESVAVSEQMEIKIDAARETYRPCAELASLLFFILSDLANVDPMYQFSLDSYIDLFIMSIDKSQKALKLEERILNLNEYHIYALYKYVCRGLFEKHKLLFSFQMCVKILEHGKKLNMDEYHFFLHGGIVVDRENQMDNPCTTWLSDESWDNITELDKLTNFHGISTSFEQYPRDWFLWYQSDEPENTMLPGECGKTCNELQRMLVVRSLRPDRVSCCAAAFITNNLGAKFVEPPVLDMQNVVEDSTPQTPIIFILSPGSDPRHNVYHLAESYGMSDHISSLSLGQGQAAVATRMLQVAVTEGRWIFLGNCHLSLSWMPTLSLLVDQLQHESPHRNFRLWLSSSPHPEFPISILQVGIKMTTEHPKGLKAGMKHLYNMITEHQFQRCHKQDRYKKLLFALCFFHTILLERKKFKMLGWNIIYEFNDADFEVSENLLASYLDSYDEMPWDALKYLIANINYGGHVTDEWDRRLLMTYINDYFCESVLTVPFYKFSSLNTYYIPRDGPLSSYKEYVTMLPTLDVPEIFGQHPNAEILSQIQETKMLFDTLMSLQPRISLMEGDASEDKVLEMAANICKLLPEKMDYEGTAHILSQDPSPLNNSLLQEMQRYNILLDQILDSLTALENGIQGLIVMTQDLEIIYRCILEGRVPPLWEKAYPSLKPLAAWAKDLVQRIDMFAKWAAMAKPPWVFWLSAFTFPTGFLTAILQGFARQHQIPVDNLIWEFIVLTVDDSNLTGPAKDGVYIKGMFLQGAGWDKKNALLVEASPMQLVVPIPTIHFKPVESKKKGTRKKKENVYTAPCYCYPNRAGSMNRPSFVVAVDLKGEKPAEFWVKRGTALLLSLDC